MSTVLDRVNRYRYLEKNPTSGKDWSRIGTYGRGGFATPLAAIYSKDSLGIADFHDLKLAINFNNEIKGEILQLLPLNCTGFNHAPYSSESGFALDAAYVSFHEGDIRGININNFQGDIQNLRKSFPTTTASDGTSRVDYSIKKAKLEVLWKMFNSKGWNNEEAFTDFKNKSAAYWLNDYVTYRVLKEKHNEASWENWDSKYKDGSKKKEILAKLETDAYFNRRLEFHRWLQWQLYEQLKDAKKHAESKSILLMGDLPFIPSRDSADVWALAYKGYFDLNYNAGALPDMYFAEGQDWGNPTPNWGNMEKDDFEYIKQKRRYAANFYHIERKDHEIGQSRLWRIPRGKKAIEGEFYPYKEGKQGDETSERTWQAHHKKILLAQIGQAEMLYTSEGLGMPPKYMGETLKEFGVPDIFPAIWTKDGPVFIDKGDIGISTLATHDSAFNAKQIQDELGTLDRGMLKNLCKFNNVSFDQVLNRFFYNNGSDRIRWKKGLQINEIPDFLRGDFTNTYDEKERYLTDIGWNGNPADEVSTEMVRYSLQRTANKNAIFYVPLIFDADSVRQEGLELALNSRYNLPGRYDPAVNWNLRTTRSLENMMSDDEFIHTLRQIHMDSGRVKSVMV